MNEKKIRLHVYMARCGIGSRRKCEQYIAEHRVQVNGKPVNARGIKVSENDTILFDGKPVLPVRKKVYIALHKPRGYLCSHKDPQERLLAKELFEDAVKEPVFHVGRLDMNSSGLIFYTNDGEFAHIVTHPSFAVEKEYIVITSTIIDNAKLQQYNRGIIIDGTHYILKQYTMINSYKVRLTLVQGKNREIRRVFTYFSIRIRRIHRVRIGCVNLGNLASGEFKFLKKKEIEWFFERTKV
jgi:23S rRNA pseudouridine2605 synthase